MLVVEDGTGLPDADAYCEVAFADAHNVDDTNWKQISVPEGSVTLLVNPTAGDTVEIPPYTYTFKAALTTAYDVLIGANVTATRQNLADAVNYAGTPGTQYHVATLRNLQVIASVSGELVQLAGRSATSASYTLVGTFANGNNFVSGEMTGKDDKELAIKEATKFLDRVFGRRLFGSRKTRTQSLEFPRADFYDIDGHYIEDDEVPVEWKQACAEMAVYALTEDLIPDVDADDSGSLSAESVQVGPISLSQSFIGGKSFFKKFTAVERLLNRLISSSNSVERG